MPEGLRDRIADAAKRNVRSMNAEIVLTLEKAYPERPSLRSLIDAAEDYARFYKKSPSHARLENLRKSLMEIAATLDEEST